MSISNGFAALVVVAAACAAPESGGTVVAPGRYELVSMDGRALPLPPPEAPENMIHSLTLDLTASEFALASTASVSGQPVQEMPAQSGPYEVRADTLLFRPAGSDTPVIFTFEVRGDDLLLRDPQNHEWLMRRTASS